MFFHSYLLDLLVFIYINAPFPFGYIEVAYPQAITEIQRFLQSKADDSHNDEEIRSSSMGADLATSYQQNTHNSSLLLFAVPGSGKTRSLRRLLSQRFGPYFQACSVDSTFTGIHDTSRCPWSRDSNSLFKFIKHVPSQVLTEPLKDFWISCCFQALVQSRLYLLSQFIKLSESFPQFGERSPSLLPKFWFDLQTSDEMDPFDEMLQLSCIWSAFGEAFLNLIFKGGYFKDSMQAIQQPWVFFCLDEAQSDLKIQIPDSCGTLGPKTLFDHWVFAFRHAGRWYRKKTGSQSQACANIPSFKILRILVTASTPEGRVSHVQPGTNCDEFYLRCDDSKTELLFGSDFKRLLAAVRYKSDPAVSLAQIYRP